MFERKIQIKYNYSLLEIPFISISEMETWLDTVQCELEKEPPIIFKAGGVHFMCRDIDLFAEFAHLLITSEKDNIEDIEDLLYDYIIKEIVPMYNKRLEAIPITVLPTENFCAMIGSSLFIQLKNHSVGNLIKLQLVQSYD